jgi:hypothetical protein
VPRGKPGNKNRIVLDETSLYCAGLGDEAVEDAIDKLNEILSTLVRDGVSVSKFSLWTDFECRPGITLYEMLYQRATSISPDTLRRLGDLLQRCSDWDDEISDVPTSCTVAGSNVESWSIGYLISLPPGQISAALSCDLSERRGILPVSSECFASEIFFLSRIEDVPKFWQLVLERERVGEEDFFAMAARAYTDLALHSDLDFHKFEGSYDEVYDWVNRVLRTINAHFRISCDHRKGVRSAIQADMRGHGIDVSPESPGTHKNAKAMRQRRVEFGGNSVLCEWHAKRLWNVDRIHFSTAEALPDGKILIGHFVDHFDT